MYANSAGSSSRVVKVTVPALRARKGDGPKISMVTAYDFTMATLVDEAGVDMVLVGDSLGMVVQGLSNTLPVSLDEMAYHCRAVSRGLSSRRSGPPISRASLQSGPRRHGARSSSTWPEALQSSPIRKSRPRLNLDLSWHDAVRYLLRLSAWFFVAGRIATGDGKDAVLWVPGLTR